MPKRDTAEAGRAGRAEFCEQQELWNEQGERQGLATIVPKPQDVLPGAKEAASEAEVAPEDRQSSADEPENTESTESDSAIPESALEQSRHKTLPNSTRQLHEQP